MHWIERFEVAAYYQLLKEADVTQGYAIDLTRIQVKHIDLEGQIINYPFLQREDQPISINIRNKRIIDYLKIIFQYRKSLNDYVFQRR